MPPADSPPPVGDVTVLEHVSVIPVEDVSRVETFEVSQEGVSKVHDGLGRQSDRRETEEGAHVVLAKGVGLSPAVSTLGPSSSDLVEKKSWVRAVKHVFTKQPFVVTEVEGQSRVVVPKEVFAGAKPLWEDFLIGKFLNAKAPHVGKIHMIVNKIWRLGDKTSLIDVLEVNETTVKFRIRHEATRTRILNRGMWNIVGIPMLISKWTPFAEDAQPAMKSIPLWVTLKNVPPTMFTDKGLEFLASAVGKPIRLHPKTEACEHFDEAQILVEADLTKVLPREYHLSGEEEGELDVVITYGYPWLPPRCSSCQKWGHMKDACLAVSCETKNSQCLTPLSEKDIVGLQENNTTPTTIVAVTETVNEKGKVAETPKDVRGVLKEMDETKKEEGRDKEWITPSKHGRSPGKAKSDLKYGEVSILSNSYSALCGKEEGEEVDKMEGESSETDLDASTEDTRDMQENNVEEDLQTNTNRGKQGRGPKTNVPPRPSLPRGTKSTYKVVSTSSTQSARDLSKAQGSRPSHH